MRVLAIIFGIFLILPGLCCLLFGIGFLANGAGLFGVIEAIIGGLLAWAGFALITSGGR